VANASSIFTALLPFVGFIHLTRESLKRNCFIYTELYHQYLLFNFRLLLRFRRCRR
jgi:hypothetical protein